MNNPMNAAQLLLDGSDEVPSDDSAAQGLGQFMRLSAEEEGLLIPAQAALFLGVSNQRVLQLISAGKFRSWEFGEKTYVSAKEVHARRLSDLNKGGRPRSLVQRLKVAGQVIAAMDRNQIRDVLS